MSIKSCPNCRLIVDERHQFCTSCGYDWDIEGINPSMKYDRPARRFPLRVVVWIVIGIWALLGIGPRFWHWLI